MCVCQTQQSVQLNSPSHIPQSVIMCVCVRGGGGGGGSEGSNTAMSSVLEPFIHPTQCMCVCVRVCVCVCVGGGGGQGSNTAINSVL